MKETTTDLLSQFHYTVEYYLPIHLLIFRNTETRVLGSIMFKATKVFKVSEAL